MQRADAWRRGASVAIAAGALVATALLVTWPLVLHLRSHLPIGQLGNATVPYFNLWALEWNRDRIAHGFAGYWDAPIFHPARAAFAFSEPQALTGLLFSLIAPLTGTIAAYNLVLLSFLVLNGLATQHWMRITGLGRLVSGACGVLGVALPFVLKELGVLQLTALFPAIFALAELCALIRAPAWPQLVRLGVWFAVALWTCVYYALFLSLFAAVALVLAARPLLVASLTNAMRPRLIGAALGGVAIALLALAPLASVQRDAIANLPRSVSAVHKGSAYAENYALLPPRSLGARVQPWLSGNGGSRNLYPGSVLLALAIAGVTIEWRGPRRRFVMFCAGCALLAVLCSFGTRLRLVRSAPVCVVAARLAGLRAVAEPVSLRRVRTGVHARARGHRPGAGRSRQSASARPRDLDELVVLAACLAVLEVVPFGAMLARFPSAALNEPWVTWLQAHPGGAVAMAPPETSGQARAFEPIALAMLQGLRHGHPLANGYSGFFPPAATRLTQLLRRFPDRECMKALERRSVRYVVAERAWVARHAASQSWPRAVHTDRFRIVYDLGASAAHE